MDKRTVQEMIEGLEDRRGIVSALEESGVIYEDYTEEDGYLNIHIPTDDGGYIRIYRAYDRQHEFVRDRNKIRVGKFTPVKFEWSGIPTFEPSGRRSF